MNWEAISAVGEILGASAVLITLIYLAVQIRQNTAAGVHTGETEELDRLIEVSYGKGCIPT